MVQKLITIVSLSALCSAANLVSPPQAIQLENGMRAVVATRPDAASAEIRVWVNAGSVHEDPKKTNVAHVIEHLMFGRFSEKGAAYFTQAKKRGRVNANTRHYGTVFSVSTRNEDLPFFMALEQRRFQQGPYLKDANLAKEVGIIKKEHQRTYSQLPYKMWRDFYKEGFGDHPISRHTSGNSAHLDKLTPKDVGQFYKKFYQPQNICLVVVARQTIEKTTALLTKTFAKWKRQKTPTVSIPDIPTGKLVVTADNDRKQGQTALIGFKIKDMNSFTPSELDFANYLMNRAAYSALKQVFHFDLKRNFEYGDLNYDYDWHSIKSIVIGDRIISEQDWKAGLAQVASFITSMETGDLDARYKNFYADTREENLSTGSYADWLGRRCGKYGGRGYTLPEGLQDTKAFKKQLSKIFDLNNGVIIIRGG